MDVIDVQRKYADDLKRTMIIFNPLNEDFDWFYDGKPQDKVHSQENVKLNIPMAKHLGNLLVTAYLNTRGKNFPREKAEKLVFPND